MHLARKVGNMLGLLGTKLKDAGVRALTNVEIVSELGPCDSTDVVPPDYLTSNQSLGEAALGP